MNLNEAREIFCIRYFRWALADFEREIQQGYPLIASIKGRAAYRALSLLESLPGEESQRLANALVKRFHKRALERVGEHLSGEDVRLIELWRNAIDAPSHYEREAGLSAGGEQAPRFQPKVYASLIKDRLKSELASPFEPLSGTTGRFQHQVGPWRVVTIVGYGSQPFYAQDIIATKSVRLQSTVSVLCWLGIMGQTEWDLPQAGQEEEVARAVTMLVLHFTEAAPVLLDGLSHQEGGRDSDTVPQTPRPRLAPKR